MSLNRVTTHNKSKCLVRNSLHKRLFESNVRERSLMTSLIRVGRGSKIAPKKGHYRVGQGRSEVTKKRGTSLMNVP